MSSEHSVNPTQPSMISPLNKGIGHLEEPVSSAEIARCGWNLLKEDLSLPTAVLYEDRLRHNLNWMKEFIAAYGLKLAPHGKTDRKSTRLNSSHIQKSRMPSSA